MFIRADELKTRFAQARAEPIRNFAQLGVAFGPVHALERGLQGADEIGGMRERDALVARVKFQVKVARQRLRCIRFQFVIVENEAQPGKGAQSLAARAGGEPDVFQVHRHAAE